jgi:hypothetical protein
MKNSRFAIATLLIAATASLALADDTKKKPVAKGEKPKASPGWVIVEEDWSTPFLFDFTTALNNAREHYRAKEDKAAAAEIDKAIAWIRFAENHAKLSTAEDLSTAELDLMDYSAALKSGKPVLAKKLDAAFAHASVVLGKYHHYVASKALGDGDLKIAGQHLMAASDLMRNAAQSANQEYGSKVIDIYDDYAPYGYWDDSVVFEKGKLEGNLDTIKNELDRLATKLKASN